MSSASDHDVTSLQSALAALLERHAGALNSESGVARAIQVLQQAMDRTIADFSERWNTRSGIRIPPEVLAQCFEYLPFNGCLAVASVSRHWRAIALAAPRLWCSFRIAGNERYPGKLTEMLKRSQAAPLSIRLDLRPEDRAASEEVNALLPQYSHRLIFIAFRDQRDLLSLPAHQLEGFQALIHSHTLIPEDLCGGRAEHLRKIAVYSFSLPLACPAMRNLQEFLGDFSDTESLSHLVRLCPRLVSLTILFAYEFGHNLDSLIAVPLPRSLERLRIGRNYGLPQDVLLADAWAGRRFKCLVLQCIPTVDEAMRHFVASHDRQWAMEVSGDNDLRYTLRAGEPEGPDTLETVVYPSSRSRHGPADVTPSMLRAAEARQLARLTALTISASLVDPFAEARVRLPAVAALTVIIEPKTFAPRAVSLVEGSIAVPLLRSFTVTSVERVLASQAHESWLFGELPRFFRSLLTYDAPRLDLLSLGAQLEGRSPIEWNGTSDEDFVRGLDELADRVELPRVVVYEPDSDAEDVRSQI